MSTNDLSLPIVTSMQCFSPYAVCLTKHVVKRCIEVTIGSDKSFVGMLDHPK